MARMYKTIHASALEAASGATLAVDADSHNAIVFAINVTAQAGTSPTITFTAEDSPDNSTWFTHTAGATISATGKQTIRITNLQRHARLSWVIGGSDTPSSTFTAYASWDIN